MDETDRPNLSLGKLTEIADELFEMDKDLWEELRRMLMPNALSDNTPLQVPRPPKLRAKFYLILSNYSGEAFHRESSKYPNYPPDPNFSNWLLSLGQRVEDHTIAVVRDIEASDTLKSFSYHGVTEDEMREAIKQAVRVEMERHHQFKPIEVLPPPPVPPHVQRQMAAYVGAGVDIASGSPLLIMAAASAPQQQPAKNSAAVPTIATELERLLVEARCRPDDIAEEVGIDERNVYRHLAGETKPSLVNLGSYEKALSKRLGYPVKLPTPVKRQRASKTSAKRQ